MNGSDVVVVGAGIVGASTARFLAGRGVSVTLLDAHRPGWGASGRNPGFVWLHTRAVGAQMELALAGRHLYEELVEELDDFEFRPSGGMIYFFEDQADVMSSLVDERRAAGLPIELLDPRAARERCAALPATIAGATWNPLDAHIRTERLVEALVVDAERMGAKVERDARVERIEATAGRATGVRTDDGRIYEGSLVVLAAGVWTTALLEPFGIELPISPMRLQVAETEPVERRFEPVLYGPTAVKQYGFVRGLPGFDAARFEHPLERGSGGLTMLELVAQRADGRLLLGCPMDYPGLDDRATVGGLALTLGVLAERFPDLNGLAIERTWAGLLPETPDALPILGPVPGVENLELAAGHVFGNVAGPISGNLLAQRVTGETPDLDLAAFSADRPSLVPSADAPGRW